MDMHTPTKTCEACGIEFAKTRTMTRWAERRFCSRACSDQGKRVRPAVSTCTYCGKEFKSRTGSKRTNQFCSVSCARRSTPVTNPDNRGRSIAQQLYRDVQPCEVCGAPFDGRRGSARHHVDSDRMNNSPENIRWLCKRHHAAAHGLSDGKVGGGHRPEVVNRQRAQAVERAKMAREMRDRGMTTAEVAAAMDVDRWTVTRWARKYEI